MLGAGPGGYAAAFYAADLGMQVTLVDEEKNPGGVCLYRGCIPSKALLHVAKVIDEAKHAGNWGVTFSEPKVDVDKLRGFKQGVVDKLTAGVGGIAKMRKVQFVQGRATLTGPRSMSVAGPGGTTELQFEHLILATGSHPTKIPDALARQPAHDGFDVRARAAGRAEVAAGDRRRLHRPRARHRLRRRSAARCRSSK